MLAGVLIHVRDPEQGGAFCERPNASPVLEARSIARLRPPVGSPVAVCVACLTEIVFDDDASERNPRSHASRA